MYDASSRTRVTTTRYERVTPAGTETADREWLLHWYTPALFRSLCAEAGLRVTDLLDDDGNPPPEASDYFTATVRTPR
jgi:hypothetical protein